MTGAAGLPPGRAGSGWEQPGFGRITAGAADPAELAGGNGAQAAEEGLSAEAACIAALTLFAVDPAKTGLVLRSPAGPVRDAAFARLRAMAPAAMRWVRVPPAIEADALQGGLDVTASLRERRRVEHGGLLAQARHAVLVLPMAERLRSLTAALVAAALDAGGDGAPGMVALDEGEAGEHLPGQLAERAAFTLELRGLSYRALPDTAFPPAEEVAAARARLADLVLPEPVLQLLGETGFALGVRSPRALLLAVAAARAAAALGGRGEVTAGDAALAAQLVFAARATRLPEDAPPPEPRQEETDPPEHKDADSAPGDMPELDSDLLIAAVEAAIPKDLLARLKGGTPPARVAEAAGRAGAAKRGQGRGRPVGVRAAMPGGGLRLALAETLRAAAPWQGLRRASAHASAGAPKLRRDDFRVVRTEQKTRSLTIFVVDASGSSALNRLGEAKGAAELLLADCYARRDQVAVIAFRGQRAGLMLPPTRSLARAKRSLAGLPAGGATPLAAGLKAARSLAETAQRSGQTPTLVLLTDGRANVALDGAKGREKAEADAAASARTLRPYRGLVIDISPRPAPQARDVALAMGARYLPLPFAGAAAVSAAVRANQ